MPNQDASERALRCVGWLTEMQCFLLSFAKIACQRLEEELIWLIRADFLRKGGVGRDEPVPVSRITDFFSSVSVKFLDILYKDRSSVPPRPRTDPAAAASAAAVATAGMEDAAEAM